MIAQIRHVRRPEFKNLDERARDGDRRGGKSSYQSDLKRSPPPLVPFTATQLKMGKKSRQSTGSQAAASPATTPKPKKQTPTKSTPVAKAPSPEPEVQADEEDWEDEDSEEENEDDDGVTEEGMQRLMALLEKENALDDFDMAQLGEGSDEEDEEASDDDEEEEGDDDDETDAQIDELADEPAKPSKRVRISTEEDVQSASEGDLALDDLESDLSVDEDAIPQRKVTKNNKVCLAAKGLVDTCAHVLAGGARGPERGNHGYQHAVRGTFDADVVRRSLRGRSQ